MALAAPQGGKIVFASNRADGNRELYTVGADGSGEHRLTFNDLFERAPAWSPDGSRIAFAGLGADGNWDIYTIDSGGGGLAAPDDRSGDGTTTHAGRPTAASSGSTVRSGARARSGS